MRAPCLRVMNIYQKSGYLDVRVLKNVGMPFIFVTGARGTGKTFGEFEDCIERGVKFVYMRRTQSEVDNVARVEELNPFKGYNKVKRRNITFEKRGKMYRIIEPTEEGESACFGVMLALSTFANIRGFDGSEFEELFYDEFIPETHVRTLRDEHLAFLNAVESIGRNRELQGFQSLTVFCASNSNRLDNAIYMGLNLVGKVDTMKRKRQTYSIIKERGILLVNMEDSPISEEKRNTALYRMSSGTGFASMALENRYVGERENNPRIKRQNITEYRPLVVIGELCIYCHKSKDLFYACRKVSGSPPVFEMYDSDIQLFKRTYGYLWCRYLDGRVLCEDRLSELLLTKIWE